jgi:hypothetical protein
MALCYARPRGFLVLHLHNVLIFLIIRVSHLPHKPKQNICSFAHVAKPPVCAEDNNGILSMDAVFEIC